MKMMTKLGAIFVLAAGLIGSSIGRSEQPPSAGAGQEIYTGSSPDTGKRMYTTPSDAPGLYQWKNAMEYCAALQAGGHKDWRVPTRFELNVMFNHHVAIGGFDVTGSIPVSWYWSSTEHGDDNAWDQRFSDGSRSWDGKEGVA